MGTIPVDAPGECSPIVSCSRRSSRPVSPEASSAEQGSQKRERTTPRRPENAPLSYTIGSVIGRSSCRPRASSGSVALLLRRCRVTVARASPIGSVAMPCCRLPGAPLSHRWHAPVALVARQCRVLVSSLSRPGRLPAASQGSPPENFASASTFSTSVPPRPSRRGGTTPRRRRMTANLLPGGHP